MLKYTLRDTQQERETYIQRHCHLLFAVSVVFLIEKRYNSNL